MSGDENENCVTWKKVNIRLFNPFDTQVYQEMK